MHACSSVADPAFSTRGSIAHAHKPYCSRYKLFLYGARACSTDSDIWILTLFVASLSLSAELLAGDRLSGLSWKSGPT